MHFVDVSDAYSNPLSVLVSLKDGKGKATLVGTVLTSNHRRPLGMQWSLHGLRRPVASGRRASSNTPSLLSSPS